MGMNEEFPKYFGCNVFNDSVMEERLPKDVYKKLKKTIDEGMGNGAWRNALYPLVSAAYRDHR